MVCSMSENSQHEWRWDYAWYAALTEWLAKLEHEGWEPFAINGSGDGNGRVSVIARRATSRWRSEPPTIEGVKANQWWWNKPVSGNPPHVLQLDVADEAGGEVIIDASDSTLFDPNAWPGEWAPALPPA